MKPNQVSVTPPEARPFGPEPLVAPAGEQATVTFKISKLGKPVAAVFRCPNLGISKPCHVESDGRLVLELEAHETLDANRNGTAYYVLARVAGQTLVAMKGRVFFE